MFDFAWSEFAVIAVVALLAIGPKDMPVAIRAVTGALKKARRMASEFQTHVDEMVREANLGEVRDQLSQIRNFDMKTVVGAAIDPDGSLRETFASNPLDPTPSAHLGRAADAQPDGEVAVAELDRAAEEDPRAPIAAPEPGIPAFIPPAFIPLGITAGEADNPGAGAPAFIPPAFIPSGIAELARSRAPL